MSEENISTLEIQAEDTVVESPAFLPVGEEPDVVEPLPKVKRKKKRFSFWKAVSIYAVLLVAVAAVALWFFHSFLEKYEAATPNAALDRYLTWVDTEDYESIYESSNFEETHLNTKAEYIQYLKSVYDNAEDLSVRQQVTSSDTLLKYSVYSGNVKLSNITLAKDPAGDGSAWYVTTEPQYQEAFTLIASDDVRVTVNGTEIHLLDLKREEVQAELFPTIEEAEIVLPTVYSYTLEGLLNPPTVTALTLNGDKCVVVNEGQTVRVLSPTADTVKAEEEALAIEAATTYAKFVARDASMTKLLEYIHPESQLYKTIRNFSNVWFNTHEGYDFGEITVSNFSRYSSDDFTCIVSFQPTYIFEGETVNAAPVNYCMTFLQVDGEWMLYSLTQTTAQDKAPDNVTAE